jgi:hypothetical protein
VSQQVGQLQDDALPARIIAGLQRMIWKPEAGVSEYDRVEATQLLGQFGHPAAGEALRRLVRDGARSIRPATTGRLLRDTALDTLLRSTAQPLSETRRFLRGYYNVAARLLRLHPERDIVCDDIRILLRRGALAALFWSYVAPLVALLILLPLAAEALGGANGPLAAAGLRSNGLMAALGLLALFGGLGVVLFNLHQVTLMALLATWGRWLPLPHLSGLRSRVLVAGALTLIMVGMSLFALGSALAMGGGFSGADLRKVSLIIAAVLPLTEVPCFMLAHDFDIRVPGWYPLSSRIGARPWTHLLAILVRLASALIYTGVLLAAFAVVYFPLAVTRPEAPSDLEVFSSLEGWFLYALVTPLLTLAVLAVWGSVERAVRVILPMAAV